MKNRPSVVTRNKATECPVVRAADNHDIGIGRFDSAVQAATRRGTRSHFDASIDSRIRELGTYPPLRAFACEHIDI